MEDVAEAVATPKMGVLPKAIPEETGAATSILGVCLATFDHNFDPCYYIPITTTGNSVIAGYALIADHPDQEYVIQEDGATSSIQVADMGLNADCVLTHAITASDNYHSNYELDSNTVNTTSTLALKIIGVHPEDSISSAGAAGNHCRFIVKVNASYFGANATAV